MTTCNEMRTGGSYGLSRIIWLVLFCVMQAFAVILVGFAALFVSFEPAWSAQGQQLAFAGPADIRSGTLLLKNDGDGTTEATRLGIDVDLTVSGPTVRARVTQIFKNPTQNWVEATYVYPLPAGGAVATPKMGGGHPVLVGEINDRQQARALSQQARHNGPSAALTQHA